MERLHLQLRSEVESLYEARPYPPVGYWSPFFQRIRWEERPTLNYRAAYSASYGSTTDIDGIARGRPRILVAGCGTFEPVVVALANPGAEILAVDLSARSIKRLQWQLRARGLLGRVKTWAGDFQELPASFGSFDFVVATGVLHHLHDPAAGLRSLVSRTGERGVLRLMVYSYWGRSLLYATKQLAASLGIREPAQFRRMIETLPSSHPYKIYFYLYDDARNDTGLADGFLHPCDKPFKALELRELLGSAGLKASKFLHAEDGHALNWERLALHELYGELEKNFTFFACREGAEANVRANGYRWNEALPSKGRLRSELAGRALEFDTTRDPASYSPEEIRELVRALYLLPEAR